jgi:pimeloyl-ACP methyl ester carboxylesterase
MESLPASASGSPQIARVGGLRIAFGDEGRGSPALVFVHGAFGNRSHYSAQVEHFAARHRVVTLDLRGHGDSEVPAAGFGVSDFMADVLAVCEAAGIDRAVFCGHSILGGGIALEIASQRPDLVAGVALLDASIPYPEDLRVAQLGRFVPLLEGPARVAALQEFVGRLTGPFDAPELKARISGEFERVSSQIAGPLMRDLLTRDFGGQLASGDYPLLSVHAQAPKDLDRLKALRPDVLLGSVIGSGHYLMLGAAAQLNAMLDRFLEIVAARA